LFQSIRLGDADAYLFEFRCGAFRQTAAAANWRTIAAAPSARCHIHACLIYIVASAVTRKFHSTTQEERRLQMTIIHNRKGKPPPVPFFQESTLYLSGGLLHFENASFLSDSFVLELPCLDGLRHLSPESLHPAECF
jgi:hypothetical protein